MTHSYRSFTDMEELEAWVKQNAFIYYHAPMDIYPVSVTIRQYTIDNFRPERNRLTFETTEMRRAVYMLAHFDRFKLRVREP